MPSPRFTLTVVPGTPRIIDCSQRSFGHPMCIHLLPGASGGMTLEASNSANAITDQANADWIDCGNGSMTADTEVTRYAPCYALRIKATVANGTAEVRG